MISKKVVSIFLLCCALGPFTTAGIFQLYCTIHPGMNLMVIVR